MTNAIEVNKEKFLQQLFQTGHFWNPDNPNTNNVQQEDLSSLALDHALVKEATTSWQGFDKNFEVLPFILHLKGIIAGELGDVGPVTATMLNVPRCPMPDFPPPLGASFHYDDPDLQRAVETMQANAVGSGSWPNCDPNNSNSHSFRIRIDITKCPQSIKAYLDKSLEACVAAYAEVGCAVRYILASSGDCEIAKRFESLGGSVIGWNEFPNPNTCNQTINGRLDTGYAPSDWRLWANLECHETGHGVGLQHTRGHIMNPSILLVWPLSWIGGPSEATIKKYFGGVPLTPPVSPTPPTEPVPTDYNGTFFYNGKFLKIKVFE